MGYKKWDQYKDTANKILTRFPHLDDYEAQYDLYQLMYGMSDSIRFENPYYVDAKKFCLKVTDYVKRCAAYQAGQTGDERFDGLYWDCMRIEAPWVFESYLHYMEKNREPNRRF